jgi:hypothetical protein
MSETPNNQEQNKAAELSQALNIPEEAISEKGAEFVDGLYEAMSLLNEYLQILGVQPPEGQPTQGPIAAMKSEPADAERFMP